MTLHSDPHPSLSPARPPAIPTAARRQGRCASWFMRDALQLLYDSDPEVRMEAVAAVRGAYAERRGFGLGYYHEALTGCPARCHVQLELGLRHVFRFAGRDCPCRVFVQVLRQAEPPESEDPTAPLEAWHPPLVSPPPPPPPLTDQTPLGRTVRAK